MKYVLSFCPEWPKCQKVPRIDILEDNKQIMIRCDCGFDKVLSLDEYLQKLSYEEGNVVPLSCPEISDAKELISEAEEHINTYLEEMKNEALKGTKKDKKVKEAYDECKNRCENVVTLVKLFTLSYFKQNEQMIKNIVNNSTFNIRKWELSDQESTIEYFNTYCIFIPEDNTDYNFIDTKTQFPSHQETINGLFKLNDERIAIYSNEKTIELLDPLNNFNVDIVIKGHPSGVLSMDQFDNDLVVSCSNSSIMLWSLTKDSYTCLHTIQSQKNFTCVRALNNNHIAAASNNVIQIYDITEGKYSQTPIKELICSNEIDNMYYIKNKQLLSFLIFTAYPYNYFYAFILNLIYIQKLYINNTFIKNYFSITASFSLAGCTTALFIPTIFIICSDLSLVDPLITEYLTFSASKKPKIALSTI